LPEFLGALGHADYSEPILVLCREVAVRQLWCNRLAREITLILAVKFVLIFALWFAFFRHPLDHDLDAAAVSRALLSGPSSVTTEQLRAPRSRE
jgi:hypothetical protein